VWAENQKGELVLRGGAQIQLFHSMEDENRQRTGQPPLVVPSPRESILPPPPPPQPRKETPAPVSGVKKATPRESPALRKAPPKGKR